MGPARDGGLFQVFHPAEAVVSRVGNLMKAVLLWFLIMVGLIGFAGRLFGFLRISFKNASENLILSVGIGLGVAAYAVFFIGSAGYLKPRVFLAGSLFILGLGLRPLWVLTTRVIEGGMETIRRTGSATRALLLLTAVVWGLSLSGALAPAIGQDELCYHLMQPKNYVRAGAVYEVPYSINSLWPYLMHMLFTLGLLLDGESLAKLFHFTTYVGTALAVYAFLRRETDARTALYGMAVYALTPVAFIQASFAYVDNALAFYVFLTGYCLYYFVKEKKMRWAALAGIFAGFAASVKLIGLFIIPIAALYVAAASFRHRDAKLLLRGAALFIPSFILCGSLWYIRAWILRGNPVYPFYPEFFGGHGWADPTYLTHGGARGLWEFLSFPWDLTMRPGLFGGEQVGMFFLAFLPLLVFVRPWPFWLQSMLYFGTAYMLVCFKVDPNTRFLLPAFAFFSCAVAVCLTKMSQDAQGAWKAVPGALFGGIFLVQSLFAFYHFKDAFWLLFHADRDAYLRVRERTFFFAKTVNRSLRPTDRILSVGEIRGYYFDNPFVLEGDFRRMTHYPEQMRSGAELVDYLIAKGFTHALDTNITPSADLSDPDFSLSRFLKEGNRKDGYFQEVLRVSSGDVRYVLYKMIQKGDT